MAITRIQAQKLCNAVEMELVNLSLGDALKALSALQLRGKVKRSRTLRDKLADQFRRQTVATQADTGTKRGHSGAANARTELKLRLMDEVLKRFEARSAQLDAQVARSAQAAAKAAARLARTAAQPAPAVAACKAAAQAAPPAEPKPAPKVAPKRASKAATKAAPEVSPKSPAKRAPRAAPQPVPKGAVRAATKPAPAAVLPPTPQGPAVARRSRQAPEVPRATAVSAEVAVRGKNIGAHARSAQARSQAKRDQR